MNTKLNLTILILLFILVSNQLFSQNNEFKLTILHCNDIHANIDQFPELETVVKQYRNTYENVLLVSAGDLFSGNPFVDKYEDKGFPMIDLMNYVQFDLSCFGNHEFDYGQETLNKRVEQADFPFICSNFEVDTGKLEQPSAFYNFRFLDSIDVCFLGLIETENDGIPSTHPKKVEGINFYDALDYTENFTYLDENAECFIALSHLGYETDILLANKYSQFDLIIGGHSHTTLDTQVVINKSIIAQTGSKLKKLGVIELTFTDYKLTNIDNYLVNLKDVSTDNQELEEKIESFKINDYLNSVIGYAESSMVGKNELGSLFTDAVRENTNADIAIQNEGGIRIYEIPQGDIFIHQVYSLDPFGNYVVTLEMNVKQLKEIIEFSYSENNDLDLQISGIKYEIIVDDDKKIKNIKFYDDNNKPIKKNKTFKVAMNTYIFDSYQFSYKKVLENSYITSAEMILKYIENHKTLNYSGVQRATLTTN